MTTRTLNRLDVTPGPAGAARLFGALPGALAGTGPALAPFDPTLPAPQQESLLAALHIEAPVEDDLAVVVTTSGSTGRPAGVELSRQALLAAAMAGLARLHGPGHWLVAVPTTSVGGLMTLVRSVVADTEPVFWRGIGGAESFTADSFAVDAATLLERAGSDPSYVSLVPTQVERIVRTGGLALDLLARFSSVVVGAADLPAATHRAALAAGVSVVRSYGMSEACGGICYDSHLLSGVTARIVDPDNHGVGRIVLAGTTLASGYRLDPERTADRFRSDGLHTDDLGRLDDGLLSVVGRVDDVVQVGGTSVSLVAVTDLLRTVPGILDAVAVARPDPEWGARVAAVLVLADGHDESELLPLVQHIVSDHLGRMAAPVALRCIASIPLLANGKPDRTALTELVSA